MEALVALQGNLPAIAKANTGRSVPVNRPVEPQGYLVLSCSKCSLEKLDGEVLS